MNDTPVKKDKGGKPKKKADTKMFFKSLGISALVLALIFVVVFLIPVLNNNPTASKELLLKGDTSFAAGEYQKAHDFYSSAVGKDGKNNAARVGVANSLLELKREDDALKYINKAIDRSPGYTDFYSFKIKLYVKTNKTSDARDFINSINSDAVKMNLKDDRPANIKATPGAGSYNRTQNITLLSDGKSKIYYTTDETIPTLKSDEFNSDTPISIGAGKTVITAVAINDKFIISDIITLTYNVFNNDSPYKFEDAKVESMVRSALSIQPNIPILYRDLVKVTSLSSFNASGNKIDGTIRTLKDLSAMNSLQEVLLTGEHAINDYSVIQSINTLKNITLKDCALTDGNLNEIVNATWITNLNIDNNQIRSLAPLAALTELTVLSVEGNNISVLDGIENLSKLTSLNLNSNSIVDIDKISSVSSLSKLQLGSNKLTSAAPVLTLNNLQELNISKNSISDISGINSLKTLKALNLSDNPLISITPLRNFVSLDNLDLSKISIDDLSVLSNMNITKLTLKNCGLLDITTVSSLQKLITLDLRNDPGNSQNNDITNLRPIISLHNLEVLYLDNNNSLSDLTPLNSSYSLKYVYCAGCPNVVKADVTNPNITLN